MSAPAPGICQHWAYASTCAVRKVAALLLSFGLMLLLAVWEGRGTLNCSHRMSTPASRMRQHWRWGRAAALLLACGLMPLLVVWA
jgi:hypothetical protein